MFHFYLTPILGLGSPVVSKVDYTVPAELLKKFETWPVKLKKKELLNNCWNLLELESSEVAVQR